MSYYFNTQVFLGYELGKEIKEAYARGKVSDEYLEDLLENGDIDYISDIMRGKFLYIGRSLSNQDMFDEVGAIELPALTVVDYMELKEKLCKEPLFKELIGDKMPKLYHVCYYN